MSEVVTVKQKITEILGQAVSEAQKSGKLPSVTMPEILLERPQNPGHGDYASSLPLKLARAVGISPLSIAKDIVNIMLPLSDIADIEIAKPGFRSLPLKFRVWYDKVRYRV